MNRIKELRKLNRMTQAQLAKMLHVSQGMISSYESGLYEPDTDMLKELAKIFGVSIDYLLDRDGEPMPTDDEFADAGIAVRRVEPPAKTAISEEMISAIVNRVKSDMQMSTPNTLNPSEQELIDDFRQLSPVQKSRVKAMIAGYIDAKYMND